MTDLDVEFVTQRFPNLGRQKVHDPRSRSFALGATIDKSTWKTKSIRIWDPRVNPNQCHGECTGCANAMMLNSVGNRVKGVVLDMNIAHNVYSLATSIDPFNSQWPPTDTGSSGIAAAQAAQRLGLGGEYRHIFGGADEIVQTIQDGRVVSVGTWWMAGMFKPNDAGIIEPTGTRVGGHQYIARCYDHRRDFVGLRCWWGTYRDVWIRRDHLNDLVMNGGDAHVQDRLV